MARKAFRRSPPPGRQSAGSDRGRRGSRPLSFETVVEYVEGLLPVQAMRTITARLRGGDPALAEAVAEARRLMRGLTPGLTVPPDGWLDNPGQATTRRLRERDAARTAVRMLQKLPSSGWSGWLRRQRPAGMALAVELLNAGYGALATDPDRAAGYAGLVREVVGGLTSLPTMAGPAAVRARTLALGAAADRARGRLAAAERGYAAAAAAFPILHDDEEVARVFLWRAGTLLDLGRFTDARHQLEEILVVFKKSGDHHRQAETYQWIAAAHRGLEEWRHAFRNVRKAQQLYRRLGEDRALATAVQEEAEVFRASGEIMMALRLHRRAMRIYRRVKDRLQEARARVRVAQLELAARRTARARRVIGPALEVLDPRETPVDYGQAVVAQAGAWWAEGQREPARRSLREATERLRAIPAAPPAVSRAVQHLERALPEGAREPIAPLCAYTHAYLEAVRSSPARVPRFSPPR